MRSKDEIETVLDYFQNREDKPLKLDKEAIVAAYQKDDGNHSLPIKILSVFGGILASLAFFGFLLVAGLYNSDIALLVFGGIFIAASIWINKEYNRIIIDTGSVSSFIIGFILLGLGFEQLNANKSIVSIFLFLSHWVHCVLSRTTCCLLFLF